jgi:hypothetical protein
LSYRANAREGPNQPLQRPLTAAAEFTAELGRIGPSHVRGRHVVALLNIRILVVFRSGRWESEAVELSSPFRLGFAPDFRTPNLGFRVARTLDAP